MFYIMLTDGHIPPDATQTALCPRINGDFSDASNYRPIALATIFSKILEQILLSRLQDYPLTSEYHLASSEGTQRYCQFCYLNSFFAITVIMDIYLSFRCQ